MKRIIITGASDGLGKALGELCVENNVEVVCISRSKPDYPAIHLKTDLTQESDIQKTANIIKEQYADFDALVNCAGVAIREHVNTISYDKLDSLFKANTVGLIFLTSQLVDLIKQNNADIMNVSSKATVRVKPTLLSYASSKWGVKAVSKALQAEFENTLVRVTDFAPDGIKTRIFEKGENLPKDRSTYLDPKYFAEIMFYILNLPKQVEISEILVNRKGDSK